MRSRRRVVRRIAREQGVSVEEVEAVLKRLADEGALAVSRHGPLVKTAITEEGRERMKSLRRAFADRPDQRPEARDS